MLGTAPLARPAAEAPSACVSSRAAPAAPRLGSVAQVSVRRLETRSRTRASAANSPPGVSSPAVPSAEVSTGVPIAEVPAPPYEPSLYGSSEAPNSFEPRVQVGPTVASLAILLAFAVVNRRVAAAVEKRKEREDAEEALRLAKLRSLDGSADFDEVQSFGDALDNARAAEAEAREVLAFLGADVRVRMPQPLGKPIARVEEEEARVGEEIRRRREERRGANASSSFSSSSSARAGGSGGIWVFSPGRGGRANARGDDEGVSGGPPGWMTATVGFVLAILTWSAVGLLFSPDPAAGPALTPEQVEEQLAMRGYDVKRFQ
jgi:hypothetical protein